MLRWAPIGATLLLGATTAAAAPRLYVSNEDGGDIAVVDTATLEVVAHIPVGKRPRGLKLAADGRHLYVALSGSPRGGPGVDESKLPPPDRTADGVGVVDIVERKLTKVLPSGPDPEQVDVSPDGTQIYVANEDAAQLRVIDTGDGHLV